MSVLDLFTTATLEERIASGESNTLEFKSAIDSAIKIAKTLVAFANTRGGTLLIGISDDRRVSGVHSESEEISKIEEASDHYCQPPLTVAYEKVTLDQKTVLVVTIPESDEKPHAVHNGRQKPVIYVRINDKSVPTSRWTGKQLTQSAAELDKTLLQSPPVKTLLTYLRTNEYIVPKRYAKLINISERRATKLLMDLVAQQLLMPVERDKMVVYTLK